MTDAYYSELALAAHTWGVACLPPGFWQLARGEKAAAGRQILAALRARAAENDATAGKFLDSHWARVPIRATKELPCAAPRRAARAIDNVIESLPARPSTFAGRGIVTCAGGPVYQTCAWVLFTLLRRLGCKLPIECWRTGPAERDATWEQAVAKEFGVLGIDAAALGYVGHPLAPLLSFREHVYAEGALTGYALKSFACLHSSFREVLFLDADNTPARDPTFLFDLPEFRASGAVFWPDLPDCRLTPDLAAFDVTNAAPPINWESGQMLFDKIKCWRALALANWFNVQAPYFYRYSWGDCGTWQAAWRRLASPYALPEKPAIRAGQVALVQHDFAGAPLFFHRVGRLGKWRLDPFMPTPGYPHNDLCLSALEGLESRRNTDPR